MYEENWQKTAFYILGILTVFGVFRVGTGLDMAETTLSRSDVGVKNRIIRYVQSMSISPPPSDEEKKKRIERPINVSVMTWS